MHGTPPGSSPLTMPTGRSFGSWPMARQNKETYKMGMLKLILFFTKVESKSYIFIMTSISYKTLPESLAAQIDKLGNQFSSSFD